MTSNRRYIPPSRRAAIVTARVAFAAPLAAQPKPVARKVRIAFLSASTPDPVTLRTQVETLRQGLRELGWVGAIE